MEENCKKSKLDPRGGKEKTNGENREALSNQGNSKDDLFKMMMMMIISTRWKNYR